MKWDNKKMRAWLAQNEAEKAAKAAAKAAAQEREDLLSHRQEMMMEMRYTLRMGVGESIFLKGDFRFPRKRGYISLTKGTWYGKPYQTVANGRADCAFVDFPHEAKIVSEGSPDEFAILKITRR